MEVKGLNFSVTKEQELEMKKNYNGKYWDKVLPNYINHCKNKMFKELTEKGKDISLVNEFMMLFDRQIELSKEMIEDGEGWKVKMMIERSIEFQDGKEELTEGVI